LKLALGPQVLLEEAGVLGPAQFVEGGEDDLADRRAGGSCPQTSTRRVPELLDQFFPAPVEPLEHGGLCDEFGDGHVAVAGIGREPAGEAQGLLQRGNQLVADGRDAHAHTADCTREPWA
jgi:hypothetical protein